MTWLFSHPSANALSRFATAEVSAADRRRLSLHLAGCARCRGIVASHRSVAAAAAGEPHPVAPAGELHRILARRAAGERVILPTADPSRRQKRQPWAALATAAGIAAILASALVVRAPEVTASDISGELHLSPAVPRPGQSVTVRYHAPSTLAGERELVLRGRYRSATMDEHSPARVVSLTKVRATGSALYQGSFVLPDTVVFAMLAVEDTSGRRVDDNDGRLWELSTGGGGEKPSLASLLQRRQEYMGRSWEKAHATARLMTELHPDSPEGWRWLLWYDVEILGAAKRDSLRADHRPRLAAFHRDLSARSSVPDDQLSTMYFYARLLEDSTVEAYWRERLGREAAGHPYAVQNMVLDLLTRLRAQDSLFFTRSPKRVVAAFDSLYAVTGPAHDNVMIVPMQAADLTNDPSMIFRWSERYLIGRPGDSASIAAKYTKHPTLRDTGLARLRYMIAHADHPARRGLAQTQDEFDTSVRMRRGSLLSMLGAGLLLAGDTVAAADTLELAAGISWSVTVFQQAADAALASGDTSRAVRLLAGVMVDPGANEMVKARAESLARSLPREEWAGHQSSARARMREQVLAGSEIRHLPQIRLRSDRGSATTLASLTGGRPAVVVMWSAYCGWAIQDLPEMARFAERMRQQDVPVVVVVPHAFGDDVRALLARHRVNLTMYQDEHGEMALALSNFATPVYYVLDRGGRLRFRRSMRTDIPRQLAVIGE